MDTAPPSQALLQMLTGYWTSQAIYVAAKLGIADLINDGPKTSAELGQATGTHTQALYRLLRMLASIGIFAEDGSGRFGMTELSKCLVDGAASHASLNGCQAAVLQAACLRAAP